MSHTNSTTNYSLPQFVTTDKPAWLTDINTAFYDIDVAVKAAKTAGDNAQSDATQALSDASGASTTATTANSKASGAIASISENFDNTATYAVGDLVMYNNLLYKCIAEIAVPGDWTGSTNWSRVTVDDMVGNLGNLNTEHKTSLVAAVNDVYSGISDAETNINNSVSFNTATITDLSGYRSVFYNKYERTVHGTMSCNTTAGTASGNAYANIDSAYRPSATITVPALVKTAGGLVPSYVSIGTDGTVKQLVAGTGYGFYCYFSYNI